MFIEKIHKEDLCQTVLYYSFWASNFYGISQKKQTPNELYVSLYPMYDKDKMFNIKRYNLSKGRVYFERFCNCFFKFLNTPPFFYFRRIPSLSFKNPSFPFVRRWGRWLSFHLKPQKPFEMRFGKAVFKWQNHKKCRLGLFCGFVMWKPPSQTAFRRFSAFSDEKN